MYTNMEHSHRFTNNRSIILFIFIMIIFTALFGKQIYDEEGKKKEFGKIFGRYALIQGYILPEKFIQFLIIFLIKESEYDHAIFTLTQLFI